MTTETLNCLRISRPSRAAILSASIVLTLVTQAPSHASVILVGSGLSSANVPVTFQAEVTISGNNLTVQLTNNSPGSSLNPADVIGSFYFDIVNNLNARPTLTYTGAAGDVYLGNNSGPDALQAAGANLKAVNANDNTWQFKTVNPALTPFLGFGIGTVGNSNLTNNFNGNIVGNIDYSIYKGDVTTANLNNRPLVKETATFNFTGVAGFTENDISPNFAFGLGTAPDSFLTPEPSSAVLLVLGWCASMILPRRRKS
jgi:hypothetical protein